MKGDGEMSFPAFRDSGQGKILCPDPPGLEGVAFPRNIDSLFPGFRTYRTIGIQTARGCPNRCIYCTYPYLEGRTIRTRQPETVAEEIAMLNKDFGKRDFFIVDSLFNGDEGHMTRVAEQIAALNLPVRISCYMQPRVSDSGIFRLLKKAGCVSVDFGTDSGSSALLASLGKPFSRDDIREASRACRDAGIDFCHSLLLGGPGETKETIGRPPVSWMRSLHGRLSP